MNFKFFLIIYLQLIYTSLANLKLTTQNVTIPTKVKERYVDMMKFSKTVVNDSNPLVITFEFQAKENLYEEKTTYIFNNEIIDFTKKPDVKKEEIQERGRKLFRLIFTKFTENTAGKYTLNIKTNNGSEINATSFVFSPPFLYEFMESRRSTEGGRMEVACMYTGFSIEPVTLNWKEVTPREKVTYRLAKSVDTSENKDIIAWDFLVKSDAGYYRCDAVNLHGNDSVILQLRVKDRLAPLWPFIGIIIEVIILFSVIIFYEKQKSNKKSAEKEANPIRQSLLDDNKASELSEGVHHRNPVD